MSHIFSNPSDTSAGALFKAPDEIFVRLLVLRRQDGHRRILLDELAGARPSPTDGSTGRSSDTAAVEQIRSEPGKQPVNRLKRDGLIGQFGIALYAIVFQRKSKHSALDVSKSMSSR
jgi:hypothetical protein